VGVRWNRSDDGMSVSKTAELIVLEESGDIARSREEADVSASGTCGNQSIATRKGRLSPVIVPCGYVVWPR
jgi:hypothetical protein